MKAFLVLEDGTVFEGIHIGARREVISEIVFNTSMAGYLEVLTDPSYAGQAVCMTYPLIGNYGICREDCESAKPWPDGLIVRELSRIPSNFRSEDTIQNFLEKNDIPGICGIDTRALTKILREKGTMNGMITTNENYKLEEVLPKIKEYQCSGVVRRVTRTEKKVLPGSGYKVALLDLGAKENIVRSLNKRNCEVTIYPAYTKAEEILKSNPDGIMLSNGPGDPKECVEIIEEVKKEIEDLKHTIVRERYFDVAEYKYQTVNQLMDNTRELYIQNERQLFADAMMRWSALSGFHGTKQGESMIRFDASSFSLKSAYNSLFVPPDIKLMINDRINQLQNRIRSMNSEKIRLVDTNYVQGTFDRHLALENDYIHFFAPGDPIFDSIVNNALGSYKGTCAACACKTQMDWTGLIFTWILYPDETILLENGLSTHMIDKYRGFMPIEQFQCAVGFREGDQNAEEEVLRLYNYLMTSEDVNRKRFQHLGSRTGMNPNIEMFINMYPEDRWKQAVDFGYKKANEIVKKNIMVKLKKQLNLLKAELLKNNGAQNAIYDFYGVKQDMDLNLNSLIFKCFSKPRIALDSVCYARMINE